MLGKVGSILDPLKTKTPCAHKCVQGVFCSCSSECGGVFSIGCPDRGLVGCWGVSRSHAYICVQKAARMGTPSAGVMRRGYASRREGGGTFSSLLLLYRGDHE